MCLVRSSALEDCVAPWLRDSSGNANDEQEHVEDEHHHRRIYHYLYNEQDGAAHQSLPGDWCHRDHTF